MGKLLFIISVILIVFSFGCVHSPTASIDSFEEKLVQFRYSLFKDMKDLDYPKFTALLKDGFKGHVIGNKLEAFYKENREEIKIYQRAILAKYKRTFLDLSTVSKEDKISEYLKNGTVSVYEFFSKIMSESDEQNDVLKRTYILFNFINLNPLQKVNSIIDMIIGRFFSTEWVGTMHIRGMFTSPLIKTTELKTDYWEIIIDEYEWVFFFEFDVKEDMLFLKMVYKR
jgi:hypothetical protein